MFTILNNSKSNLTTLMASNAIFLMQIPKSCQMLKKHRIGILNVYVIPFCKRMDNFLFECYSDHDIRNLILFMQD